MRSQAVDTSAQETGAEYTPLFDTGYTEMQLLEDEYTDGTLVIVNRDNLWSFPSDEDLSCVFDGKSSSYFVRDKNVLLNSEALSHLNDMMDAFYAETGAHTVNAVSGYRSYSDQQSLYDQSMVENGAEHTARYTAMPGCSEHHTGLAVDFSLFYEESGLSGNFEGSEESRWFLEHAWEYGFVKRYSSDKEELTGVADEPWHFRYVGLPHSYIMNENGLCLEEYLEKLRSYSWDGQHLTAEYGGVSYEIYFCSGTTVHVPEDAEYTISGNNADGFVVTAIR